MNMEEEYECPFEFQELSEEEKKISAWFQTDLVKVRPTRTCAPRLIKKFGKELYNFKPRPDDIWLIGFPRSGTTLTQEILYLLGTDLDYEKAAGTIMDLRFPVLCFAMYKNQEDMEGIQHVCNDEVPIHKQLEAVEGRRFIKSHYGFSFIHPKILDIGCKVVFIARNPKDVMVSRFYYPTYLNRPGHTFEKLWHIFKNDLLDTGNYFEMLNDAWQRRHNENLLFLFYEEVKADKKAAVLKIAHFLGKKLSEDELQKLLNHIDIDNFKKNKSLNNDHLVDQGLYGKSEKYSFIRHGKNGSWEDLFPEHLVPEIDEWIKSELRNISDFEMPESWKKIMKLK